MYSNNTIYKLIDAKQSLRSRVHNIYREGYSCVDTHTPLTSSYIVWYSTMCMHILIKGTYGLHRVKSLIT